ncbi:dihydroneopterin aldolase [Desulfitispora alkaliphila]|uniref:dihydroneopterin aldolase n=1 Tax=Desulfitispora alkaliphila TaxID=622674 RepID=UPI003D193F43
MEKIIMEKLEFYAYHGVLQEEKDLGQRFLVDVEIGFEGAKAGKSDKIEDTINYATVYDGVKNIVVNQKFNLIEKLAEEIASYVLTIDKVYWCKVRVNKPQAPIAGIFNNVAIEIMRERND